MTTTPTLTPPHIEHLLTDTTITAITQWLTTITPQLQPPALTAAADDQPPRIDQLLTTITHWLTTITDTLTPLITALTAHHIWDTLRRAGHTPPPREPRSADDDTGRRVRRILTRLGINPDGALTVLTDPDYRADITRYTQLLPNLIRGLPDSVYRDMITHLAAMTRDGASLYERTRWIRDYLTPPGDGRTHWAHRAERIALTETTRLLHTAETSAWAHTGQPMHKVWVTATDERTRPSHRHVHGQRVALHEPFTINGHPAHYPADPQLPAEESINCRCTLIYLHPDEPLPTQLNVTHPSDDKPTTPTNLTASGDHSMRTTWNALLAPIGTPTGDGRIIDPDATITHRDTPLPMLWQHTTSSDHQQAVIVGKITSIAITDTAINATGELFDTNDAHQAATLIQEGVLRPSIDLCDLDYEYHDTTTSSEPAMTIRAANLMAATLVATPAFAEATIQLGDTITTTTETDKETETLHALAAAATATNNSIDRDAFNDPQLTAPTPLTVDPDTGHVYGHLACWGTEHVAMPGKAITPPVSHTGYALFHVSTITTSTGPLSVGRLTVGCGHADTRKNLRDATAHYDNAGTCWAYVRAGEDAHGIWVAGVINPDAEETMIRAGAAAPLSGDWRDVGGHLELVAALSVNTPGFPIPRAYAARDDHRVTLVASGVLRPTSAPNLTEIIDTAIDRYEQRRHDHRQRSTRRRLAAAVLNRRLTSYPDPKGTHP